MFEKEGIEDRKTVYLPGFGNDKDYIYKNYLDNKGKVIQKNIREIDISGINYDKIKKHYPDTDKIFSSQKEYDKFLESIKKCLKQFKGITRSVQTTVAFTSKEILGLFDMQNIDLVSHSQGGLIAMGMILDNPGLLEKIQKIQLLSPVVSMEKGKSFHDGKGKGYLHPKGLIVSQKYINSFDEAQYNLNSFLDYLQKNNWDGQIEIVFGKEDEIVDISDSKIKDLKEKYPFVQIKKQKGGHYLGYK